MSDFRDSQNFKAFIKCRSDKTKFQNVLDKYQELSKKDLASVKRVSIETLSFNEACIKTSKTIDLSQSTEELKTAFLRANNSYYERVKSENAFLVGILSNNDSEMGRGLSNSISNSIIEEARFSSLDSISTFQRDTSHSFLTVLIIIIFAAIAYRGYLHRDKNSTQSVGVVRFSLGVFSGIFSGLKKEVSTLRKKEIGDNKDV